MICFPLDNTEYMADALGAWCGTRTRGVFAADGHYSVSANGDMTITVSPGLAWLKADTHWGVNAYETNPQVLTISTPDGSLSRIDAVCVRLDKNRNVGELIVKKGAYSPQPPGIAAPTRNLDYDEIYVATITVRAGATEILQSDISDQRLNENYCGIMRDGVTGIPTQQLYDQWLDWMENFTQEAQAYYVNYQTMLSDLYIQFSADLAARGEDAQTAYDAFVGRLQTFESTAKTDFEAWFETIRGILDTEAAGHLQNQIEKLQTRFPTVVLGTVQTPAETPLYPRCTLYRTQWAYGIGGAGIGPAGGGSVATIEADFTHNERAITVSAPAQFAGYTNIEQLSSTMFAFYKDNIEMQTLVLQISD